MTDYPADLYEATHTGTPGDVDFYRRVCEGAPSVLELGCGHGRVLEALDVPVRVGVEQDPKLAERARARLAHEGLITCGDMRTLDLNARFARVIAPYSTLYCMPTREDLLATLQVARAHLEDDGLLAFDVWFADEFHAEADPDDPSGERFEHVKDIDVAGVTYEVSERSVWEREAQQLVVDYRYAPTGGATDGADVREGRIVHRYFTLEELPALLAEAGLEIAVQEVIESDVGESLYVVAEPVDPEEDPAGAADAADA